MMSLLHRIIQRDPLMEAQNYETMFNDFWRLWKTYLTTVDTSQYNHLKHDNGEPMLPSTIGWMEHTYTDFFKENIVWARQVLKKNDRIVWFLRQTKVAAVNYDHGRSHGDGSAIIKLKVMLGDGFSDYASPKIIEPLEIKALDWGHDNGLGESMVRLRSFDPIVLKAVRNNLEHALSLPIPKVQNYVFTWQTPNQAFSFLNAYEKEWTESRKGMMDYDENEFAEIVMDFNDGFMWVDLGRGACQKEGDAMGHCGNVPSVKPGDRILSLRHKTKDGKKDVWKPYCTFILHGNGMLGEMKGRANEKPAERYHKYIMALLYQPIIKGIEGGGYAPERNFSLADVSEDEAEALLTKRPEMMDVKTGWLAFKGNDPELQESMLTKVVHYVGEGLSNISSGFSVPYDESHKLHRSKDGMVRLGRFIDFEDLYRTMLKDNGKGQDTMKNLLKFLDDMYEWHFDPGSVDSTMYDVIPNDKETLEKLMSYAQNNYPDEYAEFFEDADETVENLTKFLDSEVDDGDFQRVILDAYEDGRRAGEYEAVTRIIDNWVASQMYREDGNILYFGDKLKIPFVLRQDTFNNPNNVVEYQEAMAPVELMVSQENLMTLLKDKENYIKLVESIDGQDVGFPEWNRPHYDDTYSVDDETATQRAKELLNDLGEDY